MGSGAEVYQKRYGRMGRRYKSAGADSLLGGELGAS